MNSILEKLKLKYSEEKIQALLFLFFSALASVVLVVSRIVLDLLLKGLSDPVRIWPFPSQALGSFIAFLVSNALAKYVSYITNRNKTFDANNNVAASVTIYIIMVVVLTIIETIIGTPLQNWFYTLMGGAVESGQVLSTATASNGFLYQICGILSQATYGFGDMIIVFFMDKYVIMRHDG